MKQELEVFVVFCTVFPEKLTTSSENNHAVQNATEISADLRQFLFLATA